MRGAPLPFEEAIYAKNKGLWSPFGRCVAYTAGEIDIKAAKQALAKSRNKEVGAFAQQMVRDHTA